MYMTLQESVKKINEKLDVMKNKSVYPTINNCMGLWFLLCIMSYLYYRYTVKHKIETEQNVCNKSSKYSYLFSNTKGN